MITRPDKVIYHFDMKAFILLLFMQICRYLVVGYDAQSDGCDVQRVCDKVNHVPHVMYVLAQSHIPQLLHLAPDKPCAG